MTDVAIEDRLVQRTLEGIFFNNYVPNIIETIRDLVFKPSILVHRELMYPRYQALIHKSYMSRRDLIDLCWSISHFNLDNIDNHDTDIVEQAYIYLYAIGEMDFETFANISTWCDGLDTIMGPYQQTQTLEELIEFHEGPNWHAFVTQKYEQTKGRLYQHHLQLFADIPAYISRPL